MLSNTATAYSFSSRVADHQLEATLTGFFILNTLTPDRDQNSWYQEGRPNLSESTQELLEKYSKIPADQVVEHCMKTVCTSLLRKQTLVLTQ